MHFKLDKCNLKVATLSLFFTYDRFKKENDDFD